MELIILIPILMIFVELILLISILILFAKCRKLSRRVTLLEKSLQQPLNEVKITEEPSKEEPSRNVNQPPILPSRSFIMEEKKDIEQPFKESPELTSKKPTRKTLSVPTSIKENWMGVFGAIALVIGAVFFSLTSEIMQYPAVRVCVMSVASILLLGVSQKLKQNKDWTFTCALLNSVASAVILFATLGASSIDGLQFIDSPLYAFAVLGLGVLLNIFLSLKTPSQFVASLHVILCIIAFCIAPQSIILLPIGALVACVGLIAAYRYQWDYHLILIIIAFTIQNIVWNISLIDHSFWTHYVGIGCSVCVSLTAAMVHYSKKYRFPKLEIRPLVAHVLNWCLLVSNVSVHAQFLDWIPSLILASGALVGFILARIAKKKEIHWLYMTDTIISQLVAVTAIFSLTYLVMNPLDIGIIMLIETLAFTYIGMKSKEDILIRLGYGCSFLVYILLANNFLEALSVTSLEFALPIYLRMGIIIASTWIFLHLSKNFPQDDIGFVLFGQKEKNNSLSIINLFGMIFLIEIFDHGFDSLIIQAVTLSILGVIALWLKSNQSYSWSISFIISLVFVHILNWEHFRIFDQNSASTMHSKLVFLGLILLDLFLICGNIPLHAVKRNIYKFVIYALALQTTLFTYICTQSFSSLIFGVILLGLSVFAVEGRRVISAKLIGEREPKMEIQEALTKVGLAFLIGFLFQFSTVHLQINPIWNGLSIRWLTEALGILTIFYWMLYLPKKEITSNFTLFCSYYFLEILLGFTTLCIFLEVPNSWRPVFWIILAITLLKGTLKNKWTERLYIYAWGYLLASIVHVAFVTNSFVMPNMHFFEKSYIPVILAIILQLCFSYLAFTFRPIIDNSIQKDTRKLISTIYNQPNLTVLLPVFLGIALLFAFNFEKAILTILWVGLACLYLVVGLLVKSKRSIQIAMIFLIVCSIRLILFDLVQQNLSIRALVFIGVGCLMLGVSALYKKYKYRIDAYENA